MYNLIEYSSNYSETTGSWWFYSKDKTNNLNADIANYDNFKYFKYKVKLLGNIAAQLARNIQVISRDHSKCHWLIAK